jgi:hypothetical protein
MAIFAFQDRWFKPLTHPSGVANVLMPRCFLVRTAISLALCAAICKPACEGKRGQAAFPNSQPRKINDLEAKK